MYAGKPVVVFIGKFHTMTRAEAKAQAEAIGYRVSGSMSNHTDLLVLGNGSLTDYGWFQYRRAIAQGVRILLENEWFYRRSKPRIYWVRYPKLNRGFWRVTHMPANASPKVADLWVQANKQAKQMNDEYYRSFDGSYAMGGLIRSYPKRIPIVGEHGPEAILPRSDRRVYRG